MASKAEAPSQEALQAKVNSMPSWVQAQYGQGEAFAFTLGMIKDVFVAHVLRRERHRTKIKAFDSQWELRRRDALGDDPLIHNHSRWGIYSSASDMLNGKGEFAKKK